MKFWNLFGFNMKKFHKACAETNDYDQNKIMGNRFDSWEKEMDEKVERTFGKPPAERGHEGLADIIKGIWK